MTANTPVAAITPVLEAAMHSRIGIKLRGCLDTTLLSLVIGEKVDNSLSCITLHAGGGLLTSALERALPGRQQGVLKDSRRLPSADTFLRGARRVQAFEVNTLFYWLFVSYHSSNASTMASGPTSSPGPTATTGTIPDVCFSACSMFRCVLCQLYFMVTLEIEP